MTKKIIITVLAFIGILSIAMNVFIFTSLLPDYIGENERLKNSSNILGLFYIPLNSLDIINSEILRKDHTIENEVFLAAVDTAIFNLRQIQNELVGNSGGVNPETGEYMDAYGITYVNRYFYGENHFRNNAFDYFNQTLTDYLMTLDSLGIESPLSKRIEIYNNVYQTKFFKDLTVTEAMILLDKIQMIILLDKSAYLARSMT